MHSIFLSLLLLTITANAGEPTGECTPGWKHGNDLPGCTLSTVEIPRSDGKVHRATVRNGYLDAKADATFKGNVIYLEGFSDSMLNHAELFKAVTDEGYRVIGFDMEGQGGSPGDRGDTRLLETLTIAQGVYDLNALDPEKTLKVLMGWSLGGITGYAAAAGLHPIKPDAVILLAPSIAPRLFHTGAGLLHFPPGAFTMKSLVSWKFDETCPAPFVDPVPAHTPFSTPRFAINIAKTATQCRESAIPPEVKGLVIMSGSQDGYVHVDKTEEVFRTQAPHFTYFSEPGTRHLVGAERCEVRTDIDDRVAAFLKAL